MTKRSSTARSYPVRVPRVAVGPLTPTVLGECSRWLSARGYSPGSVAGIMNLLERLSVWMQVVGAGVDDIDEELLGRFVAAERPREVVCVTAVRTSRAISFTISFAFPYAISPASEPRPAMRKPPEL